jgi:general secretion pathway protein H
MSIDSGRGFTLLELLVVILLLGLGIGLSLTVDVGGGARQQKQQTLLLANALELAAQQAVLDGVTLGLDFFTADGRPAYRWLRQRASWEAYESEDLAEVPLPEGLAATLSLGGQSMTFEPRVDLATADDFAPDILLLPTREVTPFTLTLAGTAGAASVLTGDLMGRVRVDEDAPTPP